MKTLRTFEVCFLLFVMSVSLFACSPASHPPPQEQNTPAEFAFSLKIDDQANIYIGNTDGVIVKQLTDGPGYDFGPIFSPDGSKIIFCSNRSGEHYLYTMDADGSNQTQLTDQPNTCPALQERPIVWSPDGKWIAMAYPARQQQADIYIIRSDGSKEINLTDSPGFYGGFVWDPDSKSILFLDARGQPSIYRIDINNKKITPLFEEPVWALPMGYSPDGKQLLVMNGPKQAISVITFTKSGPEIKKLTAGDVTDYYPQWSRDGQRILFTRQDGANRDICLINADGSNLVNLTEGSGMLIASPMISPDGQKIIYLENHDKQWDTMIMNADGSGKTTVTDVFGASGLISWKP